MEINVEERSRIWKLASKTLEESVAMSGARGFEKNISRNDRVSTGTFGVEKNSRDFVPRKCFLYSRLVLPTEGRFTSETITKRDNDLRLGG
jgi:hypothetical protein